MIYPWEQLPAVPEPAQAPAVQDVVKALQADMAYMITHTAVLVRSPHAALQMLVNTARGQIVPRGEVKFMDGSTLEFQDIGMPQIGAAAMTVKELVLHVLGIASELGLKVQS